MQARILVIDDEQQICLLIATLLNCQGYQVDMASTPAEAERALAANTYQLIFCDIMLSREISGLDLLRHIRSMAPDSPVIMMTGYPDVSTAAEATRLGAFDYLCKPFDAAQIVTLARNAVERCQLQAEHEQSRADLAAICHSIDDALIMVNRSFTLRYLNEAALACGYTADDLQQPLDRIKTGCNGACRMALAETLRTGRHQHLQRIECRQADGKRVVTIKTSPISGPGGTPEGAVAVIRDETALHTLERTLQQRNGFHRLLGGAPAMQRLYAQIEALADVSSTVLISGESGTGKELVARALHECGKRRSKPFVAVNCAALADSLLESELFGHVRGAFTGATQEKIGRFQRAHRGTIFLDEIGDISAAMQLRLLRVLQEHEIERVGDGTPIKVDVRVITATNKNLEEKVRRGEFRNDLYYRLNVVQVVTPPLREHPEDIPLLTDHFLKQFSERFDRPFNNLSSDMLSTLQRHTWPGNVRELQHLLERACVMSPTALLTSDLLPANLRALTPPLPATPLMQPDTPAAAHSITEALQRTNGNKSEAARLLGISRRTLYRWLEQT